MDKAKKILIVDDDPFILQSLKNKIRHHVDVEILLAPTYKECVKVIREDADNIAVAIVDLQLPDAKDGSVLYLTGANDIPSIVFTGNDDINLKASYLQKHVIEYIVKNTLQTLEYTAQLAIRIIKNYDTHIVIVDDSKMSLELLALSLQKMHFKLHKAKDGLEAFNLLKKKEHDFSLVITDYHMPNMDGLELTQELRKIYKKDELSIIALSGQEDDESTSLFLKVGANDFVKKPFTYDELALRINLNLDLIDLFSINRSLATKDTLTSLYNERFFADSGEAMFLKAQRAQRDILVVMLRIDNFEELTSKYGSDVADNVLNECAKLLQTSIRKSDLLARQEDEIFSMLLDDIADNHSKNLLEKIHNNSSQLSIALNSKDHLTPTLSIGAVQGQYKNLSEMMKHATQAMAVSQSSGKNRTTYFEN